MPLGIIAGLLIQYRYLIMVPLLLVAQPFVGMTAGVLARLGFMDPLTVYLVLMGTALTGDMWWYLIGYCWGELFLKKYGRFVGITRKHVNGAKHIFDQYHASILLISKITNGLGFALVTLFTAGLTRIPFGRYMALNVIGEAMWSAAILAIGYFLGHFYLTVQDVFTRVTMTASLIILILAVIGFGHYISRLLRDTFENDNDL